MLNKSTPNDIEVLIHCHTSPEPHPRLDAQAVSETIRRFLDDGIIYYDTDGEGYKTTEKGRAWLQCILSVDYPAQFWVDKNGNVIDV